MKELFASAPNGLIGLIIFFVFFCCVLLWLLRPGAKSKYKHYGEIPLKEDDES